MAALDLSWREQACPGAMSVLTGVALVLIAGRLLFWMRRFPSRDRRSAPDPARIRETLYVDARRLAWLELVASLVAGVGLLGTFLNLRFGSGGTAALDGGRLAPVFAPALAGLGVFLVCQGAAGFFRGWSDTARTEPLQAAPPRAPLGTAAPPAADVLPLASHGPFLVIPAGNPAPLRRVRKAAANVAVPSIAITARGTLVLIACALLSILLHGSVLYVAHRIQTAPDPVPASDRAGTFLARIVPALRAMPPPPPPEAIKEDPPPPPPKPEPAPPEPPPREAPKVEAPEPAPLTERPVSPPAEAPKTEAPKTETAKTEAPKTEAPKAEAPPPPAPVAEAKEPESDPRSRKAEAKESESSSPPPAPPAPKLTETPVPPRPSDSAPAGAPPPKGGLEAPVLGQGTTARSKEKEEGPAGVDISTLKDYRQFLAREMKGGAAQGQYVPNLRFGDNKAQENREIMRYFGMELIAYPKNQKFYVYIDPERGLFSRSNDFSYIHNFSSRAIFRTSPYFDSLRDQAAKQVSVPAESLVVAQLLKPSSAAYIGWKEGECARRAGVALDVVEACDASFVKSPFGVWIVRIDRLLLKDGRSLAVEDFEWAKISASGGGQR
jgi:hypothetical protein